MTVHLPGASVRSYHRAAEPCPQRDIPIPPNYRARPLVASQINANDRFDFETGIVVTGSTVTFRNDSLGPGDGLEASITLPTDAVPLAYMKRVPELQSILDLDIPYHAERRQARHAILPITIVTGLSMLLVIGFGVWQHRLGRSSGRASEPPEDLDPASVALLWAADRKVVSLWVVTRAKLLQLVRLGMIDMVPVGTVSNPSDFLLSPGGAAAPPGDQAFVDFLFSGQEPGPPNTPRTPSIRNGPTRSPGS